MKEDSVKKDHPDNLNTAFDEQRAKQRVIEKRIRSLNKCITTTSKELLVVSLLLVAMHLVPVLWLDLIRQLVSAQFLGLSL